MKHKLISIITSFALLGSLSGCLLEKNPRGSTLEVDLHLSYLGEQILADKYSPSDVTLAGDWFICSEYTDKGNLLTAYNVSTGETKSIAPPDEMEPKDGRYCYYSYVEATDDGGLLVISNSYKQVGWNEEDMIHYADYYDSGLQWVKREQLPEDFAQAMHVSNSTFIRDKNGFGYYPQKTVDDDGRSDFDCIAIYDEHYEEVGTISLTATASQELFLDTEGNAYLEVFWYSEATAESGVDVYRLDGTNQTAVLQEQFAEKYNYNTQYSMGFGDYSICYANEEGIYGVKADQTKEKVLDWVNSDFHQGTSVGVYSQKDGNFIVSCHDENYNLQFWKLRPRTQEEIDAISCISLAGCDIDYALEAAVIEYNRSNATSRIVIKDYGEYNKEYGDTTGFEMLKKDMLDGIVADIICTDNLPYFTFSNKGMLLDMTQLMEEDETFVEEDYFMNVFESLKHKGRLERIAFSFDLMSTAAKTSRVGETSGIDMAGFMALREGLTEEQNLIWPMDPGQVDWHFLRHMQNCYVDTETMESQFDRPEFVQLLELIKEQKELGESVWSSEETMDAYFAAHPDPYKDDSALVSFCQFHDPYSYHELRCQTFGGDKTTLLGYPTAGDRGNGGIIMPTYTLSINARSLYHTEIWAFMQHLLSKDYQRNLSMPVHREAFETLLVSAEHRPMDPYGNASAGEMEEFAAYVEGVTDCYFFDDTVYAILQEEVGKYLGGDCTAEDAATMIHKRVGLYLSEQS